MKIAGRKNPGAWFRANKMIKSLNSTERANLAGSIAASDYIDSAYNALTGLAARVGVTNTLYEASATAWATRMATAGIPSQVWMGHLSWTVYDETGGEYVPVGQSEMHYFAKDLRRIITRFMLARRALRDLFDRGGALQGNPGGLPDATFQSAGDIATN